MGILAAIIERREPTGEIARPAATGIAIIPGQTAAPSNSLLARTATGIPDKPPPAQPGMFAGILQKRQESPIGFGERLVREATGPQHGAQNIPILGGIIGSAANLQLLDTSIRLGSGFDYTKPIRPAEFRAGPVGSVPARFSSRAKDEKLLSDFMIRADEEEQRGFTFGGHVAGGLIALPTWMTEFALTGGLETLGSTAAKTAGKRLLKKYAKTKIGETALKTAGWTAGAITRASVGLSPRIAEKTLGRQVDVQILDSEQEGWATSFAKAWGDVTIEAASETAGEAIVGIPTNILKKTKLGGKFIDGAQKAWMKATGGTAGAFARDLAKQGGYSNIIGEIGEERLGTILRGITNVDDFGAGKDAGPLDRAKAGLVQDAQNIGVELVILSVPGAARIGLGQVSRIGADQDAPILEDIQRPDQITAEELRPALREQFREDVAAGEAEVARVDAQQDADEAELDAQLKATQTPQEIADSALEANLETVAEELREERTEERVAVEASRQEAEVIEQQVFEGEKGAKVEAEVGETQTADEVLTDLAGVTTKEAQKKGIGDAEVTLSKQESDASVRHELWSGADGHIVRSIDQETGDLVTGQAFTDKAAAEKQFERTVESGQEQRPIPREGVQGGQLRPAEEAKRPTPAAPREGVQSGLFGQDVVSPISGAQGEFLDIEDFKTQQEKDRINAAQDLPGQQVIPEGPTLSTLIGFAEDEVRLARGAVKRGEKGALARLNDATETLNEHLDIQAKAKKRAEKFRPTTPAGPRGVSEAAKSTVQKMIEAEVAEEVGLTEGTPAASTQERTAEELTGLSKERRARIKGKTATNIVDSQVYQTALEAHDVTERQIDVGFYFVEKSGKGEIDQVIESMPKGKIRTALKKMFTFDRSDLVKNGGKAISWDVAVQAGFEATQESEGHLDLTEFAERVKDAVTGKKNEPGSRRLNTRAMDTAAEQGEPFIEMMVNKFRMLHNGSTKEEINDMMLAVAEKYNVIRNRGDMNNIVRSGLIDDMIDGDQIVRVSGLTEAQQDAEDIRLAEQQVEAEERSDAEGAAKDILEKNGIDVHIEQVEIIDRTTLLGHLAEDPDDDVPFEMRGKPTGATLTQSDRQIILLANGADSQTGYHEGYHVIRPRLTKQDDGILKKAFANEEAEAAAFGQYAQNNATQTGAVKFVFEKLMRFLRQIKNALTGAGFRSHLEIFEEIATGGIRLRNVTADGKDVQFEMKLDVGSLSKGELTKINTYMKRAGYDVRGSKDVQEILERMTSRTARPGILDHENWEKAVIHARTKKTQTNATKAAREFGLTTDPREAGYIIENGSMLDFSGKREGGTPGTRVFDHRDIGRATGKGGTDGMVAFMMEGNLRVDGNSGFVDMYTPPTTKQKLALRKFFTAIENPATIEINDGKFFKEYDEFASPSRIIREIEGYWNQREDTKVQFERKPGDIQREAEKRAKVRAKAARMKAARKGKKVSKARLKIKLKDTTPFLRPDLKPLRESIVSPLLPERKGVTTRFSEEGKVQFRDRQKKTLREIITDKAKAYKLGFDRRLESMSARLEKIHPLLMSKVRRYVFDVDTRTTQLLEQTSPFIKGIAKIKGDDARDLKYALNNNWRAETERLVTKYKLQEEYQQLRNVLDAIHEAGNEVGLEILYRGDHFPRRVKDLKPLLKFIGSSDNHSAFAEAIRKRREQAGGRELSDSEKTQVINTLLRGFRVGGISLSRPGVVKDRSIEEFERGIEKFYFELDESLEMYIQDMIQSITTREFFGKQTSEIAKLRAQESRLRTRLHKTQTRAGITKPVTLERHKTHIAEAARKLEEIHEKLQEHQNQKLEDSIGYFVDQLDLDIDDQQQVFDMLKAIMEPRGLNGATRGYVKLAYVDVLANIPVALTQIEELGLSVYRDNLRAIPAAHKALLRQNGLNLDDIGISDINQYMRDLGLQGWMDKAMFAMRAVDKFGKQTLLNTELARATRLAKNSPNNAKFVSEIKRVFGDDFRTVINDLANDRITDNVKFLMFSKILDLQPSAITETPEYYAAGGNWRIVYMLRQFTLKRMSILRDKARKAMTGTPSERLAAMADLAKMLAILTAFGVGKDFIKDWYLGKDFDLWDSVLDNMLQYVFLSRWRLQSLNRQDPSQILLEELGPPGKLIDGVARDWRKGELERSIRSIPIVGEEYYWWFGGGSRKGERNEFLDIYDPFN